MNKSRSGYKRVKWLFGKEIEIPAEWEFFSLDKLTKITDGSHFSPTKVENGFPLATVENIKENIIDINSCYNISKNDYKKLVKNGNNPEKGDVLFTKDGTVGKTLVYQQDNKIVLLSSVAIIRRSKNFNSMFCNYALQSKFMTKHLAKYFGGTAIKRIVLKHLSKYEFPLPPLPEQQKIASILSGVDALIESTQHVIEKTERLKKGLMQNLLTKGIGHAKFKKTKVLFGKYTEIPEEWEVTEFRKISIVKRGASPRPINDPKYFGQGRGWVRIHDISKSNKYLMQTKDYLSEVGEMKSVAVNKGDIIMSIAATVGKTIIVKMKACIHDGFIVFSNLSNNMNNEFLYYLLTNATNEFKNIGQHGTQSNINSELVSKTKFFKPPFLEQQKIASILSGVDAYIQKSQQRKEKLKHLKKGLMQKLLTGQIRVSI